MSSQDQNHFSSFAHAQVSLTNQIFDYLHQPTVFLFCPTGSFVGLLLVVTLSSIVRLEYCSQMCQPSLEKSLYLQTLGSGLHGEIEIFWTGPKVISRRLTSSHLCRVNDILQRRVTIWDNLHANDYDQRRLYLGPFSGRSSDLSSRLSGLLINPNCEFEVNFIPFNTLGQWFHSLNLSSTEQIDDDDDTSFDVYRPGQALDKALLDWLPEFNKIKSSIDEHSSLNVDEDSQDSITENLVSLTTTTTKKAHRMECDTNGDFTLDDIRLLVDLFYLPYENGSRAQQIFLDFFWLRFNYSSEHKVRFLVSSPELFIPRFS